MNKSLWVFCPFPVLKKPVFSCNFTFFLTCSVFGTIYLPLSICHFFFFIKSPQPRFHKSYPQSKTFLNTQVAPSRAVFCSQGDNLSNLMLITAFVQDLQVTGSLEPDVSMYSNINYGTTFLILIHYNSTWFSCLDLSVTLDHNISQNLRFFIFKNTFWRIHS